MSKDDELPQWVGVLERPPIDLRRMSPEAVVLEYEQRLKALLDSHGLDNTSDDWRELAIILSVEFHPAFKPVPPSNIPVSGRPRKDTTRWILKQQLRGIKRRVVKEHGRVGALKTAAQMLRNKLLHNENRARQRARQQESDESGNGSLAPPVSVDPTPSAKTLRNLASQDVLFPPEFQQFDHVVDARRAALKAAKSLK